MKPDCRVEAMGLSMGFSDRTRAGAWTLLETDFFQEPAEDRPMQSARSLIAASVAPAAAFAPAAFIGLHGEDG